MRRLGFNETPRDSQVILGNSAKYESHLNRSALRRDQCRWLRMMLLVLSGETLGNSLFRNAANDPAIAFHKSELVGKARFKQKAYAMMTCEVSGGRKRSILSDA